LAWFRIGRYSNGAGTDVTWVIRKHTPVAIASFLTEDMDVVLLEAKLAVDRTAVVMAIVLQSKSGSGVVQQ
jgi:hypothetical protein